MTLLPGRRPRITNSLAVVLVFVTVACNGAGDTGATAAPTDRQPPAAETQPGTDRDATPEATATPEPIDPTAWIAGICSGYSDFWASDFEIDQRIPIPPDASVEDVRAAWLARLDEYGPVDDEWRATLDRLGAAPGGEPLHEALADFLDLTYTVNADLRDVVEDAASVEEINAELDEHQAIINEYVIRLYASVAELDEEFFAALAAYEGDCELLNAEAAAIPLGRETAEFTAVIIEDDFEGETAWYTEEFEGGSAVVTDGAYVITATAPGAGYWVNTDQTHDPAVFGDVRIETTLTRDPVMFAGLVCRDDGAENATAYVMEIGGQIVWLWRKAPDYAVVARRTLPGLTDGPLALAMECVGGADGAPVTIAVEVDGERVLEWVDEAPVAAEGFVGMVANSSEPAAARFDDVRILVP